MRDDSLSRVTAPVLTFDLVVATLGRGEQLDGLLRSLEHQAHTAFRLLVVDQNEDDRVREALARHPGLDAVVLSSPPGLSRARNVALRHLEAEVVAFPDDDCVYPDGLLEAVARELASRPDLDGIGGQAADPEGRPSGRWPARRATLELDTLWNHANSHTIFLRRELVERVGGFDEALGLGAGTPWHSGEEIELLVRALRRVRGSSTTPRSSCCIRRAVSPARACARSAAATAPASATSSRATATAPGSSGACSCARPAGRWSPSAAGRRARAVPHRHAPRAHQGLPSRAPRRTRRRHGAELG